MKNGFLPINIKVEDRIEYYNVLDVYATKGDAKPFRELIEKLEEEQLDKIIKLILDDTLKSEYNKNS